VQGRKKFRVLDGERDASPTKQERAGEYGECDVDINQIGSKEAK